MFLFFIADTFCPGSSEGALRAAQLVMTIKFGTVLAWGLFYQVMTIKFGTLLA